MDLLFFFDRIYIEKAYIIRISANKYALLMKAISDIAKIHSRN